MGDSMKLRRFGLAIGTLLARSRACRCGLSSLFFPMDPSFIGDPGASRVLSFLDSSPPVIFRHGTATIEITKGGEGHDQADPSERGHGSLAHARPRPGCELAHRRLGARRGFLRVGPRWVQTQLRIVREDTDPALSADGSGCAITFTNQNEQSLHGTATCKGLRWVDAAALLDDPEVSPSPAAGHPPFDATITFSATP